VQASGMREGDAVLAINDYDLSLIKQKPAAADDAYLAAAVEKVQLLPRSLCTMYHQGLTMFTLLLLTRCSGPMPLRVRHRRVVCRL
jgi:hypothetical protein